MLLEHVILVVIVSTVTLFTAALIDVLFSSMPLIVRIFVQIPLLVITFDAMREWTKDFAKTRFPTLEESEINSCFFLTASLVSLGSVTLFSSLKSFHPFS